MTTDYDSRIAPYDKLGNLVLEGIKNISGSSADPLFDWPSDKQKNVQKIQMPPIESISGPLA